MSEAPRENDRPGDVPLLTGLRGLAALIVFTSHAAIVGFLPDELGHGFGQVGVMIFFVLSGFLMGHLYLHRPFQRSDVQEYAQARVGRVMPLYFLVLAVSILVATWIYGGFRYAIPLDQVDVVMRAALFIEGPFELWTIPVEVQFYAVFVLVWWLYQKIGRPALLVMATVVLLPGMVLVGVYGATLSILPTFGYAFVLGVIFAEFLSPIRSLVSRLPRWAGAFFLVLLCLNLPEIRDRHGWSIGSEGQFFALTWIDPLTWALVVALFSACLAGSPSLRVLDSRVFKYLGRISYGFYLVHYPVLELVDRCIGNPLAGLILALGVSLSLSAASYQFFERPVLRRIRARSMSRS